MYQYTMKIEGMMCGMCEAHVNDALRGAFKPRRVTSSHAKGQTVLLSERELDEEALRAAVEQTGYRVTSIVAAPYEKRGFCLFGRK